MRVTIDLMKKSTQIIDSQNQLNMALAQFKTTTTAKV